VPELADVRPVGIHREQVGLQVAVAAAVLRVARRRKDDPAIRQVGRIHVRRVRPERQLFQPRTVGVHLENVEVFIPRPPHREQQARTVVRHLQVTDQPLRLIQQRRGLPAFREVDRADRSAQAHVLLAQLAEGEIRPGVVVVLRILLPHHIDDLVLPQNRMERFGGNSDAQRNDGKR